MKDFTLPFSVAPLRESLASVAPTTGRTHNFYHYPARFSPGISRAVIETFSAPGDVVLDPFMGGGTSIVEGLALGRRMLGSDLNALAHFVADVRTTPLSTQDEEAIRGWGALCALCLPGEEIHWRADDEVRNLPRAVEHFMAGALNLAATLRAPRQLRFARCALLRLGQWALDCRDFVAPRRKRLAQQLPTIIDEMFAGLNELVDDCREAGLQKNAVTGFRTLLNRNAIGIDTDPAVLRESLAPKLVFTSPPYPGVHVLYHRWQYRGRKETAAPYWIAAVPDGCGASYYTAGSRTPTGLDRYFSTVKAAFESVRRLLHRDGLVVQLVGFNHPSTQIPRYLEAMDAAGYEECPLSLGDEERMTRRVPNRKWYAKLQTQTEAATEILLVHRPRRAR